MGKIKPAHIGFDFDGVVADTGGAFIRIAKEEYGLHSISLEDITFYEVVECLDVDRKIIDDIASFGFQVAREVDIRPVTTLIFANAPKIQQSIEVYGGNLLDDGIKRLEHAAELIQMAG